MQLSVVIPVLNDAHELSGCLKALKEQTRAVDEIVVVDNGCTDSTRLVARDFGARIVSEPLRGIPAAASAGYDSATGDIIARLDADSRPGEKWAEGLIEHFCRVSDNSRTVDAVTGPGTFLGLGPWASWCADLLYMRAYFALVGSAMAHPPLFGSNFAMRRSLWLSARKNVNRTLSTIHDDIDLSFALPAGSTIVVDSELSVGISARPFADPRGMLRRFEWAFRSIALGWRQSAPWTRWARRIQNR